MRRPVTSLLILTVLLPGPALACMWDYDTLAMETRAYPGVREMIAGHFLRHSSDYYRWRIEDRSVVPRSEWTPGDFDDVAVAMDKLGRQDEAIKVLWEKIDRFHEKDRYESEANLGTVLVHAGRYEEGLEHIRKAIEINPDAHFGREIYQQLLVEYLIERRETKKKHGLSSRPFYQEPFNRFVYDRMSNGPNDEREVLDKAVNGVVGMMRFGHHDSPILLEVLGDLLIGGQIYPDGSRLAARAFLRASQLVDDPKTAERLREDAERAISLQHGVELSVIEQRLQQEVQLGEAFAESIAENERRWMTEGANLDKKFAETYYDAETPTLPLPFENQVTTQPSRIGLTNTVLVGCGVCFFALAAFGIWLFRPSR